MSETEPKRPLQAALGRSIVTRLGVGAIVTVVGGCMGCAMVAVILLIANNADPSNPLPAYLGTLCVVSLFMGSVLGVGLFVIMRQTRRFDAVFVPLGLEAKSYALRWRQYLGTVSGRDTTIRFSRGPTVNITVQATSGARVAMGTRTGLGESLSRTFNLEELHLDDPDYTQLIVRSKDADWTRALFADSKAKATILRLMADASSYDIRGLYVEPDALRLLLRRIPMKYVTTEAARQWLDDLVVLAGIAEKLPPPVKQVEPEA